jgi:branched-chain amino acid transport system permease protein
MRRAGVIVALALALVAPQVMNVFWTGFLIQILVLGLFALSIDLLAGYTGILPMGHAAFFAVAAYTTAILEVRHGVGFLPAAAAGLLAGVLLGAVFGVAVRTSGVYFILVTLAMGHVVWGVLMRWTEFTGGDNGITNVPPPTLGPVSLTTLATYYYLVLAVVLLCALGYRRLTRSPFGLALQGIRESESRMRALGCRTGAHKYAAFVLSALLAATAGVLYVHWNRFVSPATANFLVSAEGVLMVILGGSGTITGMFLGPAIILTIRNYVSGYLAHWMIVLGGVFIVTVLWAPQGIMGLLRPATVWRRPTSPVASAARAGALKE